MMTDKIDDELVVTAHLTAIDERVQEAALDMQVAPEVAFWDVAMNYLETEVSHQYRSEVCRCLGLDPGPDVWARWEGR